MSVRKAFVLGAVLGAGVLAAVGAVSAASSGSARPEAHSVAIPAGAFKTLAAMNQVLTKIIDGNLTGLPLQERIKIVADLKKQLVTRDFAGEQVFGLAFAKVFLPLDRIDVSLATAEARDQLAEQAGNAGHQDAKKLYEKVKIIYVKAAKKAKDALEKLLSTANQPPPPPPGKVSLTTFPTWTHNTDIHKSNICINVKTEPPQAFFSADVTGPGGFHTSLPKTPLHLDGTRQTGAEIAQAGEYKYTLTVYDANGDAVGTVANTFTVADPPQDGPTPPFGPPCPKPTQ